VPHYYLNLCSGAEFVEDEEGVELGDYAAARAKAVESLRACMASDLLNGHVNTATFVEIENERHEIIETVFFEDVIRLRNEPGSRPPANER